MAGVPHDWVPVKFLTLRVVHTVHPAIHQLQLSLSCSSAGPHRGFCLWVSALVSCDSLYPPICLQFSVQQYAPWLHFPDGSKRAFLFIIIIFACSALYLWLGQHGYLWAPSMPGWTPWNYFLNVALNENTECFPEEATTELVWFTEGFFSSPTKCDTSLIIR